MLFFFSEIKGRFCKRVGFGECALVPVSGVHRSGFCTLTPGFWYHRSVFFVPSFRFFGAGEHPPKPPFWKPPFCAPPNFSNRQSMISFCRIFSGLLGWAKSLAIVIAESLARVTAAIRIAGVRWRSYLPSKQKAKVSPHRPCVHRDATRIARLAFTRLTFVPRGTAEWPARVDRVSALRPSRVKFA